MTARAKTNWRKRSVKFRTTRANGVEELLVVEVGRALKRLNAIVVGRPDSRRAGVGWSLIQLDTDCTLGMIG